MDDLFAPSHLIIIAIIALLVFGPGKLPELGAGLGKAIREFKASMSGITGAVDEVKTSVTTSVMSPPAEPQAQPAKPQAEEPRDTSTGPAA
ncbi:MAG TPA: twin-arginine translocase TatA/TatE family subunit [Bacillota bacterium]|nr:twin-arginine translocase TatA/TatE family subunit [Bacillota bacterium]